MVKRPIKRTAEQTIINLLDEKLFTGEKASIFRQGQITTLEH